MILTTLAAGKTWRGNLIDRRKDGRLVRTHAHIYMVLGPGGRPWYHVLSYAEIGADAGVDDLRLQPWQLEALWPLTGTIAEHFGGLLHDIATRTNDGLRHVRRNNSARGVLEQVADIGRRGVDLAERLRAVGHRYGPGLRRIDLRLLIGELADLLAPAVGPETRVAIAVGDDPLPVLGKPAELHQMLRLLAVAVAAHAPELHLSARLDHATRAAEVCFRACPKGPGISPVELADTVLDTLLERANEPGVTLAFCLAVVERAGGTVRLFTEAHDLICKVRLPLAPDPAPNELLPAARHVLLAHDDQPLASLLQAMLEHCGHVVTHEPGIASGLRCFSAHPHRYDVFLTSLTVRHLTPEAALAQLWRHKPGQRVVLLCPPGALTAGQWVRLSGVATLRETPVTVTTLNDAVVGAE